MSTGIQPPMVRQWPLVERIRKLRRLSGPDQRLLLQTFALLILVRIGLFLVPFLTLRRLVTRAARMRVPGWGLNVALGEHLADAAAPGPDQKPSNPEIRLLGRISWANSVAQRYVPRVTCLTQALAAQVILGQRGLPSRLRLGVAKGTNGELIAHAWVESGGVVVVGGFDLDQYRQLQMTS